MTDWAEHLLAAKTAVAVAERELALQRLPGGIEALMKARLELWNVLDIVNAREVDKP